MSKKVIETQTNLTEAESPKFYYNLAALVKNQSPPLRPDGTVIHPTDLEAIFPKALIEQEMSQEEFIPIPEEVQKLYNMYRATPLHRAYNLEKRLGTPAKLYFKYEGVNPSGSHKLNSAIPQVYYNKLAGVKKLTTETGAGQWGTALSVACALFDVECEVFMVKSSSEQKPLRKQIISLYGATMHPSPSNLTEYGKSVLKDDPDSLGSLGIAISEAVEVAAKDKHTHYALGSVLNHVIIHQTVIGLEAQAQLKKIGEKADMVIASAGGGSHMAGLAFPFIGEQMKNGGNAEFVAVEPKACPTLTRGKYTYDFGDSGHMTPLMKQYTLGNGFMPPAVHAGGLRYHGMNALISQLKHEGVIRAEAVFQREVFEAALEFAKSEIILPAPESAHTLAQVIKEAKKCKETGEEKVILFIVSGHGNMDLAAYADYFDGKLLDYEPTDADLEKGFATIPKV